MGIRAYEFRSDRFLSSQKRRFCRSSVLGFLREFRTPSINRCPQSLDQYSFHLLVEISNPSIEIGVTFEIEIVDHFLNRCEMSREGFSSVGAGLELVNRSAEVGVKVDESIGTILEFGNDRSEFSNVVSVLATMRVERTSSSVSDRTSVECVDKVFPSESHT